MKAGVSVASIHKIRRLLNLLERIQSGRVFNARELSEFCNVSRRTTFRDIKTLQDSGIPILFDSEKQGYWIAETSYLPPTDFTLSETLTLILLAQELGDKIRGLPFQEAGRDAALKLHSNLPNHLQQYVGELSESMRIESDRTSEQAPSRDHYERTMVALTDRKKMRIRYTSLYEQTEIKTLVSPYRLLFKGHAWYVIGRSSLHRAVRTFHIGRIIHSEISKDDYEVPPRFSLQRYFGNAWRLVRERGQRVAVRIHFQSLVAQNVAEVTWHKTQKNIWQDDGTLIVEFTVDGIRELSWWVLGYGDQAEALEPPELRQLLDERIKKMAQIYRTKSRKNR